MLRGILALVACVFLASAVAQLTSAQQGGLEFNSIVVTAPSEIHGSLQILLVPLNVSDPRLLSVSNVYVVSQGIPRRSYLFSTLPPVVAFLEGSAFSGVYEVWYGGGNPYSALIGFPGSNGSIWLAFDDFDYETWFWYRNGASTTGSRCYVEPGGYLALARAYSSKTAHAWLLHGRRALNVVIPEPIHGFVVLRLTAANFTDIVYVRDGSDVYPVDPRGTCLRYSVLYFSKEGGLLLLAVDPEGNTLIHVIYGGENPCSEYGVG